MKRRHHNFSIWGSALLVLTTASCGKSAQHKSTETSEQHQPWIDRFLASQRPGSSTVIEAVEYQGRNNFHVMPEDRADDVGDEHILYDEQGNSICEFGGIAGHVTKGQCSIDKIIFREKLFPK